MQHIFVYGTLMSKFSNPFQQFLADNARLMGNADIYGELYDLDEYPGVVLLGSRLIKGELYFITLDLPKFFCILDDYEGVEYRRVAVEVFLNNTTVNAWVYEFIDDGRAKTPVLSGCYAEYRGKL